MESISRKGFDLQQARRDRYKTQSFDAALDEGWNSWHFELYLLDESSFSKALLCFIVLYYALLCFIMLYYALLCFIMKYLCFACQAGTGRGALFGRGLYFAESGFDMASSPHDFSLGVVAIVNF